MAAGKKRQLAIPPERVERRILLLRGQKVMLDADLAELYGALARRLNEQVRRNIERFPPDFMFQVTAGEHANLRSHFATSNLKSQSVISNWGRGGRRYRPLAFTEQGVAMLSSVLRGERAVQVNIAIMRAFVKLREMLASHRDLARKLDESQGSRRLPGGQKRRERPQSSVGRTDPSQRSGAAQATRRRAGAIGVPGPIAGKRDARPQAGLGPAPINIEMKYDAQFKAVFDAIRELMEPPEKPRRSIGFSRQLGDALSGSGRPLPAVEAQPQRDRGPQGAAARPGVGATRASRIGRLSRSAAAGGAPR